MLILIKSDMFLFVYFTFITNDEETHIITTAPSAKIPYQYLLSDKCFRSDIIYIYIYGMQKKKEKGF